MYIKNLNQLKKNLKVGMTFEIIEHLYRPECVGEPPGVCRREKDCYQNSVKRILE